MGQGESSALESQSSQSVDKFTEEDCIVSSIHVSALGRTSDADVLDLLVEMVPHITNSMDADNEWILVSSLPSAPALVSPSPSAAINSSPVLFEENPPTDRCSAQATVTTSESPIVCDGLHGPSIQGKLYRGRDTPEWAYYRDNWTNGFGFAFSGGGSRACTSAWGIMNSIHSGGRSKFLTFAYMSSNSGGGWCLQTLLYKAQSQVECERGYDVDTILGVHCASSFLSIVDLTANIDDVALVGHGTTLINVDNALEWWDSLDSYFSIPRSLGQDYRHNDVHNHWQLCTFGQDDKEILKELTIDQSNLAASFKMSARTLHEGYPLPIAVGCAWKYEAFLSKGCLIYPVEFTPSCSGVFRDQNSNPPVDTFGNNAYPDYLVTNALFGTDLSLTSEEEQSVSAPMKRLTTFPQWNNQKLYRANSLGVNEFLAISSNAAAVKFQESYQLSTVTASLDTSKIQTADYNYLDGGVCCNTGLMSLLQRRLSHINVFITNALRYFDDPRTTIHDISDISRYFGESIDYFEDYDHSMYHEVGDMPRIAACFGSEPASGIQELYRRLKFNWKTYGTAVATMSHALQPTQVCQDFYGLSGSMYTNYSPYVNWYLVQRPPVESLKRPTVRNAPFWSSLTPEVFEKYMELVAVLTNDNRSRGNFPYYHTKDMLQLESVEANAMKYYTSAMGDFYVLPHVRKNNSPFHFWVDDSKTRYALKDYFQLEDKGCDWHFGSKSEPIISIIYSPMLQAPVFVHASFLECQGSKILKNRLPENVQIKCALHTPCGIFVGGSVMDGRSNSAFLGLYLYSKRDDDGVISFKIEDFVSILPDGPKNVPSEMKQLTSVGSLLETAPVENENGNLFPSDCEKTGTFPQILLAGGGLSVDLTLCWKVAITPHVVFRVVFAFDPVAVFSHLSAKKLCTVGDKEVVWLQDKTGTSNVVRMIEGTVPNLLDPSVDYIFDVAECPLLNGLVIFFVQNSLDPQSRLMAQVSQFNNCDSKVISRLVNIIFNEKSVFVNASAVVYAEYQGNVFCVRIGSEIYVLQDLNSNDELVLCKLQNNPKEETGFFMPSSMY